jgi:hypothetical protein
VDLADERKEFFDEMCLKNTVFTNCSDGQEFAEWRWKALAAAQGGFLLTGKVFVSFYKM